MKVSYDPKTDILYIVLKEGPIYDSKELDDDIRIEYDKEGQIAGIEVINSRNNLFKVVASEIARQIEAATTV